MCLILGVRNEAIIGMPLHAEDVATCMLLLNEEVDFVGAEHPTTTSHASSTPSLIHLSIVSRHPLPPHFTCVWPFWVAEP
uniref:Uncharacterized protein n=1 Tax=Oryza barthii TaxID=65489 RepID=A0A0D3GP31_9ORYZ